MSATDLDLTTRYAPNMDMTDHGMRPVLCWLVHPARCPICADMIALECVTAVCSRWYGVQSARINSELRMVITGTPIRDEVRMKWPVCSIT